MLSTPGTKWLTRGLLTCLSFPQVEALLGVKKALEMDVQLYQVGPRACFPSLLYFWAVCS